jgi:hypothetical protein
LAVGSLLSVAGTASASPAPRASASLSAAQCGSSQLRELVSTNFASYGPGTAVKMTVAITNVSTKTCSITVGPTSPSFSVANSRGKEIWNNCFANDRPGACAMYLMLRSLKPAATFSESFYWKQKIDGVRVPVGVYELTVRGDGSTASQSVKFVLAPDAPITRVLTQAQSGRSYSLRVGDLLIVNLSGPASYSWTPSVSSDQAVLLRWSVSSGRSTHAIFVAGAAGRSRVTAVDNPKCYPQCASPSRPFSVTVTVSR